MAETLRAGGGLGVLPQLVAGRFLRDGSLVRVLSGVSFGDAYQFLLWPESRFMSVRLRRFLDLAPVVLAPGGFIPYD